MEGAFTGGPFAAIAKRNMEMFEAAASAFKSGKGGAQPSAGPAGSSDEVAALKEQLAGLQAKIDKLVK